MSLLIKALDKAQAEKAQVKNNSGKEKPVKPKAEKPTKSKDVKSGEALSLQASEDKTTAKSKVDAASKDSKGQSDDMPQALKGSAADVSKKFSSVKNSDVMPMNEPAHVVTQKQAANVFTAKHTEPTNRSVKLALLIGLIALGIMGALAYWYQSVFNTPDIVIPPRPVVNQEMPAPLPELVADNALPILDEPEMVDPEVVIALAEPVVTQKTEIKPSKAIVKEASETGSTLSGTGPAVEETLSGNEAVVGVRVNITRSKVLPPDIGIASESASIKVTQRKTTSGVNPILMRAYEAYNAGNDHQAQQGYKQVLKRYGPNVDAMLGLGAIAGRQGRLADASGWYRRVMEVEPRNEVATAGLLNLQQASQPQSSESNIKSMLAIAPNDANLHAALGDLYANQDQWPAAQQAYFDAYRFNPSAENAFNLGVSLDQLGKPKLALPYYQEALEKAGQSNVIDAAALKARIASIQ